MKGSNKVVPVLNGLLGCELSAMDQYFIHSRMYEDWGLFKLYKRIDHEFDDEKGHASRLIERILLLEGTPDMASRGPISIGKDVPSMIRSDLDLELADRKVLKEAIALLEVEQDYVSRELVEDLLVDTEEDHAYWLEQQLGLIDKVGLENYLQAQMGEDDE